MCTTLFMPSMIISLYEVNTAHTYVGICYNHEIFTVILYFCACSLRIKAIIIEINVFPSGQCVYKRGGGYVEKC